jgi:hypothetical protein
VTKDLVGLRRQVLWRARKGSDMTGPFTKRTSTRSTCGDSTRFGSIWLEMATHGAKRPSGY